MLTDLADVLRAAGQQVLELPGWKTRGESDGRFDPIGILLHHDAMALGWNSNPNDDLNVPKYMSQNGNDGSQLWVSRHGLWVVMAAGRKWHAGLGQGWADIPANSGNSLMLGVETDHTDGDPWPAEQMAAINDGCRALVRHYGWQARDCCGHLEYAPGRKHDPSGLDLNAWRAYLASSGKPAPATTPTATPPEEDDMPTAKEIVDELLSRPIPVTDNTRDPVKQTYSVQALLAQVVYLQSVLWQLRAPSAAAVAAIVKANAPAGTSDATADQIAAAIVQQIGAKLS